METIGGRIRALRLARGIKQNKLTAILGWKYTRLSMIERGNLNPSIEDIKKLAATFGCSIDEILGQNGNSNVSYPPIQIQRIPLLNWKNLGQSSNVSLDTERLNAIEFVPVIAQEVTEKAFALVVEGDSMTNPNGDLPSFPNGTQLIVESEKKYKAGDFIIVRDDMGNAVFKKLTTDGSNWYLKPINPSYPVIKAVNIDEQLIGVVVRYQIGNELN